MKMLAEDVFKDLCICVTLDAPPVHETVVQKFIEQLREQPSLFFTSQPQITNSVSDQTPIEQKGIEEEEEVDDAALPC